MTEKIRNVGRIRALGLRLARSLVVGAFGVVVLACPGQPSDGELPAEEELCADPDACPEPDDPLRVCGEDEEGATRCDGSRLQRCIDGSWRSAQCRQECRDQGSDHCAVGCLITAEGARCLCVASEYPCGG